MNPNADERNMEGIMIVKVIAALTVISLISLQLLLYPLKIDGSTSINNVVYAVGEGKPISIKLNYAHFAPLTNNSKSHQVKVIGPLYRYAVIHYYKHGTECNDESLCT